MKKFCRISVLSVLAATIAVAIFFPFKTSPTVTSHENFETYSNAYISMLSTYGNQDEISESSYVLNDDLKTTHEQDKFKLKRLILKSDEIIDDMGAIAVANGFMGWHIHQYSTISDTVKAYEYYSSLKSVQFVEADSIIKSNNDLQTYAIDEQIYSQYYYSSSSHKSWGASHIGADVYNNYLKGINDSRKNYTYVAVLDTGIDTDHASLQGRVDFTHARRYTYNTSTGNNSITTGKNSVEDVLEGTNKGHGTHVSGIIADLTPENVKIIPIKILNNNGTGYLSSAIVAINYITSLNSSTYNISAINLSIGGDCSGNSSSTHVAFETAILEAQSENISVVMAAGNWESIAGVYTAQNCSHICPANVNVGITVASIDSTHTKSNFSNYGSIDTNNSISRSRFEGIDICAPGNKIMSTLPTGSFGELSGTSMATPHVTACIALLHVYNYTNDYSIENIETLLLDNAIDLGDTNFDGHGLVNLSNVAKKFTVTITNLTPENGTLSYTYDDTTETIQTSKEISVNAGDSLSYSTIANNDCFLYEINEIDVSSLYPNKSNTHTLTSILKDENISIYFAPEKVNITATVNDLTMGSISPSDIKTVDFNSNKTFTLSFSDAYKINDIKINDISLTKSAINSIQTTKTFSINNIKQDTEVFVEFTYVTYSIKLETNISSFKNPSEVASFDDLNSNKYSSVIIANKYSNKEISFSILDPKKYYIESILINGSKLNNEDLIQVIEKGKLILNSIVKNQTVTFVFAQTVMNVTISSNAGGNVLPAGSNSVLYGDNLNISSVTPLTDYTLYLVKITNSSNIATYIDGSNNSTIFKKIIKEKSYTVENVTDNLNIDFTFVKVNENITLSTNGNGNIYPINTNSEFIIYEIVPNVGYEIENVLVDGVNMGKISSIQINDLSKAQTIHADFKVITFNINIQISNGKIIEGKTQTVEYGKDKVITILPNSKHTVSSVLINGKSYKVENNIIKLENIMENINISIKCSSENDVFENLTISKLIVFIIIIVCSIIAMIFIIKLITKFINKKQE